MGGEYWQNLSRKTSTTREKEGHRGNSQEEHPFARPLKEREKKSTGRSSEHAQSIGMLTCQLG